MRRTILGGLGAAVGAVLALAGHTVTDAGPGTAATGGTVTDTSTGGRIVTGPVVRTEFGPVQVEVEVEVDGGEITDVTALQTPDHHRRSVAINDRAVPILNRETLAAQSAQIDMVSGATVTSRAYRRSLQAALDAAR